MLTTFLLLGMSLLSAIPGAPTSNLPQAGGRGSEINGYVFDNARRPIEKARVELMDETNTLLSTTRTNGSGFYSFKGLSSGTFQVRVIPDGTSCDEQTKRISLVSFSQGGGGGSSRDLQQVDFSLRVKGDAAAARTMESSFAQEIPPAAKKIYEKAVSDIESKKLDEGIAGLRHALELFPTYFNALDRLGTEYIKRGEHVPGQEALTKALEINPRSSQSLYWLGIALYNLNKPAEAVDALKRSTEMSPKSINLQMWLGFAYIKANKPSEATTYLKRAIELAKDQGIPGLPDAHFQLARIYNDEKRYKESADELELYLKAKPDAQNAEALKGAIKKLREKAKQ